MRLRGVAENDTRAMLQAAGQVDVVLDLLPPTAGTGPVRTAAMSVRERGRVVLMGGVGMLGGEDLGLPYPWLMRNSITVRGQWMYPREAPHRLAGLVSAGLLDLDLWATTTFGLDEVQQAVRHAAEDAAPFRRTVLLPTAQP